MSISRRVLDCCGSHASSRLVASVRCSAECQEQICHSGAKANRAATCERKDVRLTLTPALVTVALIRGGERAGH